MRKEPPNSSRPSTRRSSTAQPAYFLRVGEGVIPITASGIEIGRSPRCDVTVDDGLASRRHARVAVGRQGAIVEDLDSSNGVFVNGERVERTRVLESGDVLLIGRTKFELVTAADDPAAMERARRENIDTIDDLPSLERSVTHGLRHNDTQQAGVFETSHREDTEISLISEQTRRSDAVVLIGQVADKMIAAGQVANAERILRASLLGVLSGAEGGREDEEGSAEVAADYAVRLAHTTNKAEWVEYVIRLYHALGRPIPIRIVDDLYAVVRKVPPIRIGLLRDYLELLAHQSPRLGASDRFVLQRLQGLAQLAATR